MLLNDDLHKQVGRKHSRKDGHRHLSVYALVKAFKLLGITMCSMIDPALSGLCLFKHRSWADIGVCSYQLDLSGHVFFHQTALYVRHVHN